MKLSFSGSLAKTKNTALGTVGLVLCAALLGACGPAHSSATAGSAKASAQAVVAAPANVAAENAVKADVSKCFNAAPATSLVSKTGRAKLKTCVENLVPAPKRAAFGNCLFAAVQTDKAWTKAGRNKFEKTGVAPCVIQSTK